MTTFDDTTTELRSELWRPFALASLVWVLVLAGFALFGVPRASRGVIWAMVGVLAALAAATVFWMARRALRLCERQLTTHLVPGGKKVDRDDIADIRVVRQAMFSNLQVIHRDGRRTMLNLTDREANAGRNATAIRLWADVEGSAARLRPAEPSGETQWNGTRPKDSVALAVYLLAQSAAVLLAPLWTRVPWQGWVGMALSAGLCALVWWRSAPAVVRLEGDVLVAEGPQPWRLPAVDVARVVTVAFKEEDLHLVESVTGDVYRIGIGTESDAWAATVQEWARRHGGGQGRERDFVPPRRWSVLPLQIWMVVALMLCAEGVTGGRFDSYFVAIFVLINGATVLMRDRVVRDWSRP